MVTTMILNHDHGKRSRVASTDHLQERLKVLFGQLVLSNVHLYLDQKNICKKSGLAVGFYQMQDRYILVAFLTKEMQLRM